MPRPKRGERKAQRMLDRARAAGISVRVQKTPEGPWGLVNPSRDGHTIEQREMVREMFLFCIAYPRCFGTMVRMLREAGEVDQ